MTSPTPSEPRTGQQLYHAAPLTPALAVKVAVAAIVGIYGTQIVFVVAGLLPLAAACLGYVAVVVGLWMFVRRRGLTLATLGIRRAPMRFFVAAALIGISMWYVSALVVALIDPPGDVAELEKVVDEMPLAATLIALALCPAIAEELVFRGVLTQGLATRLPAAAAIGIAAVVFALYHVFPPQIVSAVGLGIVLGFLTLRARSIVPAIVVHVLNNTIAILLSRDELPAAKQAITAYPVVALGVAVVLVGSGLALAAKGVA